MRVLILLLFSVAFLRGEDFRISIEGVEDEAVVSLPENHEVGKSWPAVFFYHGTNGRPDTSLMRAHTEGKDWIVVGMPYAQRGTFQLTPEGMEAELAIFRKVRAELQKRANLDPKRIYVSGMSKGGWVSELLLQKERSLAGAAILAAGHMSQLDANLKAVPTETPVFLGVGRLDQNYPFSLRARIFWRKLGAQVEMETWRGLGHSFPRSGSEGLKEWLAMRIGRRGDKQELQAELSEILDREDEFERWWGLVEFGERPFVKADEDMLAKVKTGRSELEKKDAIAREARILKESRRLLALEISKKTLSTLEEIVAGYDRIAKAADGTPQGEVAEEDHKRVSRILELAREQYGKQEAPEQKRTIRPPNDGRRFPVNPLVR